MLPDASEELKDRVRRFVNDVRSAYPVVKALLYFPFAGGASLDWLVDTF